MWDTENDKYFGKTQMVHNWLCELAIDSEIAVHLQSGYLQGLKKSWKVLNLKTDF